MPVPVVVICGFLGAGKTTLVSHVLENAGDLRLCVLVNDFGELDIDASLIARQTSDVVSLTNGCICCNRSAELVDQLAEISQDFDAIVIESSGISDAGAVVRAIGYPRLRGRVCLDNVVTVVDPDHFSRLEGNALHLARAQLEHADLVVLNKSDQCAQETRESFRARWLFPDSRVYETSRGRVPIDLLLGMTDGNTERGLKTAAATHGDLQTWTWAAEAPMAAETLRRALLTLPPSIYRAKGFCWLNEFPAQRCLVQLAGGRLELSQAGTWHSQTPQTRIVLIGEAAARQRFALAPWGNDASRPRRGL